MDFAKRLWGRFDMLRLSTLAAVCLMLSIPALAQDEPKVDCDNAQTQVEMNYCARVDWEEADQALNTTYKEVRAKLADDDARAKLAERDKEWVDAGPTAVERLLDAQRAWITFRDAHCEVVSFSARGGSMQSMLYSDCLATLTRQRTKQLESLVGEY